MTNDILLDKLIRAFAICVLYNQKPLKTSQFQNTLKSQYSFEPLKLNDLSWQEFYEVMFYGESSGWFRYDEQTDTLTLQIKIPKLQIKSNKTFGSGEEVLQQLTALQLASAFQSFSKKSLKNVLPQLNGRSKQVPKTDDNGDVVLVNTPNLADEFLNYMAKQSTKAIGFDCEGVNLGRKGKLTLVQISAHGIQYLFDMKLKDPTIINAVKTILGDECILKVIHDCENVLYGLFKDFGIIVTSFVDTSIFYQKINDTQSSISFNDLCELYKVPGNSFNDLGKKLHTSGCWGNRSFTKEMSNYASGDVRTLVQLYDAMTDSVKDKSNLFLSMVDKQVEQLRNEVYNQHVNPPSKQEDVKPVIEEPSQQDVAILKQHSDFNVTIINQIYSFLDLFPKKIQEQLSTISGEDVNNLIEVAMDKGRPYELFFYNKKESYTDPTFIVKQEEIDEIVNKLSFGTDNRAGMDGSLHRISAMLNRESKIIGLTLRVGRAVMGRSKVFSDLIEEGKSILLLGKPGAGKTTFIRDFAKTLSESRRVVVVDTSCEIGGFGDIPHVAIGKARRMQVADIRRQQEVMIQAVQNHTPEVIIIDEIGTKGEVVTARTISQRGVILCGSAHGDMKSILKNPILCDLLGGVESVIVPGEGEKMRLQLKADPVFDVVIQLPDDNACNEWKIFTNLRPTVQNILAKRPYNMELRKLVDGKVVSSNITVE